MTEQPQRGSGALVAVAAMGLMFLLIAQLTQFAVFQYGRGAVRSAAMSAARVAAPEGATQADCVAKFDLTLNELLGGPVGEGVGPVRCVIGEELVTVTVDVTFDAWLPGVPSWSFQTSAVAVRERAPQ